ncbi:hypothetical protein PYCCODRAFT_1382214 [Trametes coccinea BRFM310]|uniref:Uncharacterized protein n=1 Tax=Trametes coccinea (strain BRFM310) TaxID=1353009 RepID=A0A1Y2J3S4_TRAC3|nr:hypothetical protein PYCCODRAFT_1382214 [Trametes coccinea BRFM310]
MAIPLPSPATLAHRARLAKLISELRPTNFNAPLTRLRAHRIPTLWTLYRGIMRDAPTETIRSHMREFFRTRRHRRAQGDVTRDLRIAHNRWEVFKKARTGDEHFQTVCMRYSRMIEGARIQARADYVWEQEGLWWERMRTRPIMTGGYLKPSLYNKPLPRLVPQPLHITGMIVARRKARARRAALQETLKEYMKLIGIERDVERRLLQKARRDGEAFEAVYADGSGGWSQPILEQSRRLARSFELERQRAATPYPPELLEQIKAARREKVANKTRERERERRGEMTNRLLRQMRQSPPAHRLAKMSERRRRMDAIARGASEVGYVAKVKRALGFKLRDPDAWKAEAGRPENKEMLDRMAQEIEKENARRRSLALDDNNTTQEHWTASTNNA